jgi:hypothetical protein
LSASANLHTLQSDLAVLSQWFSLNSLSLNPDKSDTILLGTHRRNSILYNISHINVARSTVPLPDSVKLLGVTLDKSLTFNTHVNLVSQSCYYHMKAHRHIRHCLDSHTASFIAHALISSRLDFPNSVFLGAPQYVTNKLQCIPNALAKSSLQSDSLAHSQSVLQLLHWLPVHSRIRFKLVTITYKALSLSLQTLLITLLHVFTYTNLFALSAAPTSNILFLIHLAWTLASAPFAALLLQFGMQYLLKSAPLPLWMPSNGT